MATDCIFCRIANKEIPATIVHEDKQIIAFQDINAKAPVHVLIIPRKHIAGIKEVGEADLEIVAHIFASAKKIAAGQKIDRSGFRLVVNSGADAGQAVNHLHVHLLGGRQLSWPPG